jgi:hypothetical protein
VPAPSVSFSETADIQPVYELGSARTHFVAGRQVLGVSTPRPLRPQTMLMRQEDYSDIAAWARDDLGTPWPEPVDNSPPKSFEPGRVLDFD